LDVFTLDLVEDAVDELLFVPVDFFVEFEFVESPLEIELVDDLVPDLVTGKRFEEPLLLEPFFVDMPLDEELLLVATLLREEEFFEVPKDFEPVLPLLVVDNPFGCVETLFVLWLLLAELDVREGENRLEDAEFRLPERFLDEEPRLLDAEDCERDDD
jgi:hypothetical protein